MEHEANLAKIPKRRLESLHYVIKRITQQACYSSVIDFHTGYSELLSDDAKEATQFSIATHKWWPFCYTQEKRQAYLREVFELVKDEHGSDKDLYQAVRKLRKVYDPEVDLDSKLVEADELMAAMLWMGP